MYEWYETHNGNHIRQDDGETMTAFLNKHEKWQVVCDGFITSESYESAYDAMEAVDDDKAEFVKLPPRSTPWRETKSGNGWYRRNAGRLYSVKQAKSGNWYILMDGVPVKDQWFESRQDAQGHVDRAFVACLE